MERLLEKVLGKLNEPMEIFKMALPIKLELTILEKDGAIWIKIEHLHRKSA